MGETKIIIIFCILSVISAATACAFCGPEDDRCSADVEFRSGGTLLKQFSENKDIKNHRKLQGFEDVDEIIVSGTCCVQIYNRPRFFGATHDLGNGFNGKPSFSGIGSMKIRHCSIPF